MLKGNIVLAKKPKKLIIKDLVYGKFEINEPVLIELINSKPIQRLKGVWQHGLPQKYYYRKTFTRYDHSIGVMLILRKLNASLEEQIAGLLHDASHTAFSHVVDFLYKTHNENYGDDILEQVLRKSNVPKILKKHKINFNKIIDAHNFSLLENNAPDICADRLDYTLREVYQRRSSINAKYCYNNLIVKNKEIIFGNKKSAELFTKYYFDLQKEHWGNPENMLRYELIANVLRYAANKKIISLKDLHKDDQYVLNKLIRSKEKYIKKELSKVFKVIKFEIDENNFEFDLRKKYRFVDPKFYDIKTKKITRYSKINPKYLRDLEKHRAEHEKGYRLRILN